MRTSYLICYDIADARRLRYVSKLLNNWGLRIQYSIFECNLTKKDLTICKAQLLKVIDVAHDQVLFVRLGPTQSRGDRCIEAMGKAYHGFDAPVIVV